MATVVRIKRAGGKIIQDCDIYIGRRCTLGGWDLPESKWANPFTIKECGSAEEACRRYEDYLRHSDLIGEIEELRGKVLGCWCKGRNVCHGDVLVKLLEENNI